MIKGIIFDFDGLILDTEYAIFQSWQELFQSQGAHLDVQRWLGVVGTIEDELDYFDEIEAQTGQKQDWKELRQERQRREWELVNALPVLPGVLSYLESARKMGLKTGIASTSPREWVGSLLERHGLAGYFDCIRTREYTTHLKPNPEPYLVTLRDMGLGADQTIALEDSPPGVASAKGAGLYCVAVLNQLTRLMPLDHADLVLVSLADLSLEGLVNQVQSRKNGRSRSGDMGGEG